jgi:cell wall-associated NlpC family hydrolase
VQVFEMAGIKLPRTAALQYNFGVQIGDYDMLPGDLVFFIRNNKIGHVGIYVGNNQFIHSSTSRGVILQNLDDEYYRTTFVGFKKILETV